MGGGGGEAVGCERAAVDLVVARRVQCQQFTPQRRVERLVPVSQHARARAVEAGHDAIHAIE